MDENLTQRIKQTYDDYENTSFEVVIELLDKIKNEFKSDLTVNYLGGKLEELKTSDDSKKVSLIKKLKPYFDWYLTGKI